jgi:nucleoside-diphosphate-sugar epimerase
MSRVLVTGASGFVGGAVFAHLEKMPAVEVEGIARSPSQHLGVSPALSAEADWSALFTNKEVVIHAAARAHIMQDEVSDPLSEYRKVNVEGTLNLARQAATVGIKRFIFISSIGVNGNTNTRPFTVEDEPNPSDSYAQSKWEAEQGLWDIQRETGIEIVIIRPPLVYGPGAPGNFGSLVRWVEKGIPLPLGAIHNKRSLVALDNLVDLIATCIEHPAAANQVFLAGDGEDISTTELLRGVARAMGKPSCLIPVPTGLLMMVAAMLGKKAVAQRLLGSLQVDISKAQNLLSWQPPLMVEQGLKRCFESRSNS